MKTGFFILFRNIRNNLKSYLLEFLMVFMAAVLIFCVFSNDISQKNENLRRIKSQGKEHAVFEGNVQPLSQDRYDEYGIKNYVRYKEENGTINGVKVSIINELQWFEDINCLPVDIILEDGRLPSNENEAIISLNTRYLLDCPIDIGSRITFTDNRLNNYEFTVTGFYSIPFSQNNTFERMISNGCTMTDFKYVAVEFTSEYGIEKKCDDLSVINSGCGYTLNGQRIAEFYQGDDGKSRLEVSLILIFVIVVAMYLMIRSAFAVRKGRVEYEYAIMRSYGAKIGEIRRIALIDGLIPSVIGGCAGAAAGYFIRRLALKLGGVQLTESNAYKLEGICEASCAAVVLVTAMMFIQRLMFVRSIKKNTIYESLSTKTKVSIKKRKTKKYKNPIRAYVMTSLLRNRGRVIICIVAFAFAVLMYVMFSNTLLYMNKSFGNTEYASPYYEISVMLNNGYSATKDMESLENAVKKVNGVEKTNSIMASMVMENIDDSFGPAGKNTPYRINGNNAFNDVTVTIYDSDELDALKKVLTGGA